MGMRRKGEKEARRREKIINYPRSVKQIFTKRSAPQPAIMKTPAGGTVVL